MVWFLQRPTMTKLQPLSDFVLLRLGEAEARTPKGIILPDVAKERPRHGEVLAIGPGRFESGVLLPVAVRIGDVVLLPVHAGMPIKVDGEELSIVRAGDILAVVMEK